MGAIPVVIPVTFTLEGEHLSFTPAQGAGRAEAIENRVVAFETDRLGPDGRTAWDVHVTGIPTAIIEGAPTPRFRLSTDVMAGWTLECG